MKTLIKVLGTLAISSIFAVNSSALGPKEMSKIKFKDPDKTDPKWQALNKKVRDHNAKMSGMAVKEDRLEALTSEVV